MSDVFLLLDELTVAETSGLRQEFFAPLKSPANPVIVQTEPWEAEGPYLWGNRLIRNPDTGQYQLWYTGYRRADNHYRWGYAVSDDGINWEKPPLFRETFDGRPARNMLPPSSVPDKAASCVARDPRPGCDPARRYAAIGFTYQGEVIAFSPDGVRWTPYAGNPIWHVPSDIIHAMWDPRRGKFVAYFKEWEFDGRRILPDGRTEPFRGYSPTMEVKNYQDRAEVIGPWITFHPAGKAEVRQLSFPIVPNTHYVEDGGGSSLSGEWSGKRVQCFAESDDFIHWEHEQLVLRADAMDCPTANIQYMFVFQHGGYYIAVLNMHDESGLFHHQLAFSGDGIAWKRPWRGKFLETGSAGSFDEGMVLGPVDPVILGDEMLFYYGGCRMPHYESDYARYHPAMAIGRATLRLDGFSARTAGADGGTLLTQPVKCAGEELFVNADARDGVIEAEVVDAAGNALPGFERSQCRPISGDSTGVQVRWKERSGPAELKGRSLRIRFHLKNARLYSFRI